MRRLYLILLMFTMLVGNVTGQTVPSDNTNSNLFTLLFTHGLKARLSGDYKKALETYIQCYKIDSSSSALSYEIAKIFMQYNDLKNAEYFINAALAHDSTNNKYYVEEAIEIKLANKQYNDLLPLIDKLIKANSSDVNNYIVASKVAIECQQYDKALAYLDQIPGASEYTDYILPIKLDIYLKSNSKKKAYKLVNNQLSSDRTKAKSHYYMAEYYFRTHDNENGMKYLINAVNCSDGDVYLFDLASMYLQMKNYDKFFEYSLKALSSEQIYPDLKYNKMYSSLSNQEMLKDLPNVKEFYYQSFDTLISQYPDNDQFYYLYIDYASSCYDNMKTLELYNKLRTFSTLSLPAWRDYLLKKSYFSNNREEILRDSEEALQKFPNDPLLLLINGESYLFKQDYASALIPLKKSYSLLDKYDDNQYKQIKISVMNELATAYYYVDSVSHSYAFFDEILKMDPYNVEALNNYSYYLSLREQRLDEAEKMSRKTLEISPSNPTYLDTYSWVLYKKKLYTEARFIIEQAITNLAEDNNEIFDHYADILYRCGEVEEAVKYWQKSYDIENSELVKRKIDEKRIVE